MRLPLHFDWFPRPLSAAALGALTFVAATPAHAAVVPGTVVLKTGDTPTGGPAVTDVRLPFVNDANEVAFVGELAGPDHFVWIGGAVAFVASGDPGSVLTAPEDNMSSNGMGDFVYQPDVMGADGLYSQLGVLATAGQPAVGVPGATWINHGSAFMVADGSLYFLSSYDTDANSATTEGRILYFTPDGTAAGITPVFQTGDTVMDGVTPYTIDVFALGVGSHQAYSTDGAHSIRTINTVGPTTTDEFVMIDGLITGTPREGTPTGDGDNWENFDIVSINNGGDWIVTGDTDGATTSDEVIAFNGSIVVREGDTVGGVTLGSGAALRFAALSNLGQAAYGWNYSSPAGGRESAFFACNTADIAGSSQVIFTTLDDEIDIDGDGIGDFGINDISAAVTQTTKAIGDTPVVYVEVDLDDGGVERNAIVGFDVNCCGNGMVDPGEECDDGNPDDTDMCLATCVAATCGDGFVQAGVEECDDGNDVDTDDCPTTCAAATCGDGFVQDGVETCDDGNDVDTDDCPTTCVPAECGDGFVQDGVEECDDGNDVDTDDCANDCTMPVTGTTGTGGADSTGDGSGGSGMVDDTGPGGPGSTSGIGGSDSGSGDSGDTTGGADDGGGCSCRTDGPSPSEHGPWAWLMGLSLLGLRRRRRP
jgi:MYXO-CTERM domain-containing protein